MLNFWASWKSDRFEGLIIYIFYLVGCGAGITYLKSFLHSQILLSEHFITKGVLFKTAYLLLHYCPHRLLIKSHS